MKSLGIILANFAAVVCLADEKSVIERVLDIDSAKTNPVVALTVWHAIWPDGEYIKKHICDNSLIQQDVKDMQAHLEDILREQYRPVNSDMKNAFGLLDYMKEENALPDLVRDNDYLFLVFTNSAGVRTEVQDGRFVSVLLIPREGGSLLETKNEVKITKNSLDSDETKSYIKEVALKYLNIPENVASVLTVFGGTRNRGGSTVGTVRKTPKNFKKVGVPFESDPDDVCKGWYSEMSWWCDGRRVLFVVDKMTKEDTARVSRMSNSASVKKPRRFQYRGGTVQSANNANAISSLNQSVISDDQAKKEICTRNLRMIDALKEQWKLEKNKKVGDEVVASEIDAYNKKRMPPVCPEGGTYTYNAIGVNPDCSFAKTNSDGTIVRHSLSR